jgi:hypothetical protein
MAKQSGDRKLAHNTDCPQCNAWPTAFARLILVSHPQTQIVSVGQPSSISPACIHLHLSRFVIVFLSSGSQEFNSASGRKKNLNFLFFPEKSRRNEAADAGGIEAGGVWILGFQA